MTIRTMLISDYSKLLSLFKNTPGITVREADSKESILRYLDRNHNLNFVAVIDSNVIACVMCGHDGRRGYLQHLLVSPKYRNRGIGQMLFEKCLDNLEQIGIQKTHIFVLKNNTQANEFWSNQGWDMRDDINMYSYNRSSNSNI